MSCIILPTVDVYCHDVTCTPTGLRSNRRLLKLCNVIYSSYSFRTSVAWTRCSGDGFVPTSRYDPSPTFSNTNTLSSSSNVSSTSPPTFSLVTMCFVAHVCLSCVVTVFMVFRLACQGLRLGGCFCHSFEVRLAMKASLLYPVS